VPPPECVDCIADGVTTYRPPHADSGPRTRRCTTHHRARKKTSRMRAHALHCESTYDLSGEQYWAMYEAQGGRCAGCGVATGKTKRLAVDHDHTICDDHAPNQGCPRCIRGLLCGPCNVAVGRYDIAKLARLIKYLSDPPALKGQKRVRTDDVV
jgi:Recombination endonuclease VII